MVVWRVVWIVREVAFSWRELLRFCCSEDIYTLLSCMPLLVVVAEPIDGVAITAAVAFVAAVVVTAVAVVAVLPVSSVSLK